MKRLFVCVLMVALLFSVVSVCGETDVCAAGNIIDFGECSLVYNVEKQSETGLRIDVLTADGLKKQVFAVGKIKLKYLGLAGKTYTVQTEREYDFSKNQLDAAIKELDTIYGDKHQPYIAGILLDSNGYVDTVFIPGGNLSADTYESYFATVSSGYWTFHKDGAVTMPNVSSEKYKMQDNTVIYAYNYDFTDLHVYKLSAKDIVGKTYTGTIYSLTENKKAEVILLSIPSEEYTGGVIETIAAAKNLSGKDAYKITFLKNGKIVTKYTQDKNVIDKYKFYTEGTDYSVKIASGFYPGAVVYFRENEKGEISRIEKLYPIASETGKMSDSVPYYMSEVFTTYNSTPIVYWYGDDCEIFVAYGKVIALNDTEKRVVLETKFADLSSSGVTIETDYNYSALCGDAEVKMVDYSDGTKVRTGSYSDIDEGDYVLIYREWGTIGDVVVYRNFTPDSFVNLIPVSGIKLDKTELSLNVGNMDILKATVNPSNAVSKKVNWSSSDESIITVDDGIVTAVGKGEAIITATSDDGGKTAECKAIVGEKQSMSISDLTVGDSVKFSVNLLPDPKGRVVAVLYDGGNVVDAKTVVPGQTKIDFELQGSGKLVKVFWFDSALRPYTEVIKQDI